MSAKTRINRPTTATPRKVGTRRYVHVSARIADERYPDGELTGKKVALHGTTYRKQS